MSPADLPHNDFVRFKVPELEERAGCMCLRFETAKKVQSVDVEASAKVEKMKVTNVHGKLTGAQTFDF